MNDPSRDLGTAKKRFLGQSGSVLRETADWAARTRPPSRPVMTNGPLAELMSAVAAVGGTEALPVLQEVRVVRNWMGTNEFLEAHHCLPAKAATELLMDINTDPESDHTQLLNAMEHLTIAAGEMAADWLIDIACNRNQPLKVRRAATDLLKPLRSGSTQKLISVAADPSAEGGLRGAVMHVLAERLDPQGKVLRALGRIWDADPDIRREMVSYLEWIKPIVADPAMRSRLLAFYGEGGKQDHSSPPRTITDDYHLARLDPKTTLQLARERVGVGPNNPDFDRNFELAVTDLGELGDESDAAALRQIIGDKESTYRFRAALALGYSSRAGSFDDLTQMWNELVEPSERDWDELAQRAFVLDGILATGHPKSVPFVAEIAANPNGRYFELALTSLGEASRTFSRRPFTNAMLEARLRDVTMHLSSLAGPNRNNKTQTLALNALAKAGTYDAALAIRGHLSSVSGAEALSEYLERNELPEQERRLSMVQEIRDVLRNNHSSWSRAAEEGHCLLVRCLALLGGPEALDGLRDAYRLSTSALVHRTAAVGIALRGTSADAAFLLKGPEVVLSRSVLHGYDDVTLKFQNAMARAYELSAAQSLLLNESDVPGRPLRERDPLASASGRRWLDGTRGFPSPESLAYYRSAIDRGPYLEAGEPSVIPAHPLALGLA